ncbi:MAG TPA: serine/threonine protein kinase, partial [Planctomycetaceae bacterium]|nr:serine/threonine protein kinase [Planctomycetaceae bacterium]
MSSKQPKPQPAKARRASVKSPLPGECKTLGKYQIIRKIGAGGMGAVYLAKDIELKRTVALKVLPKERAQNPILVKRFRSEARTAAQLKHDNIATIYEAGEADGYLYIALEYVDGIDVHDLVQKRGVIPVRRSIEIIKQVARALQHAHERGVVHRDIKPSNLLVTRDGTVKLTDMGLARSVDDTAQSNITRAGTTVGTVDYMPPEQARSSKAADIRSDIYSLGCTWYHMLTGHPPYPKGDLLNKLNAHATQPPPDPRDENPSVPESVVAVIHRMMAKKPEDRYQTPDELLADLDNAMLSREEVTDRLLEALADDESGRATDPAAATSMTGASVSGPLPLPPREDSLPARKAKKTARKERKWQAPDLAPLKWVAIVVGGLACLLGLGYVVSQYGAGLDQPQSGMARIENPFEEHETGTEAEQAAGENQPQASRSQRGAGPAAKTADDAPSRTDAPAATEAVQPPWSEGGGPIVVSTETWRLFLSDPTSFLRKGEGGFLPRWVREGADAAPPRLTTFSVSDDCLFDVRSPTLNDVLADLPASGGIIELEGDGPFFLQPVALKNCGNVWIRGGNDSRPVVVLVPGAEAPLRALVSVQEGALTLHNLHFVVVAEQFPTSEPLALLAARDADVAAVGCSWSLRGVRPGQTVALSIERPPRAKKSGPRKTLDRAARICLERVVIRGERLQPLEIHRDHVD